MHTNLRFPESHHVRLGGNSVHYNSLQISTYIQHCFLLLGIAAHTYLFSCMFPSALTATSSLIPWHRYTKAECCTGFTGKDF